LKDKDTARLVKKEWVSKKDNYINKNSTKNKIKIGLGYGSTGETPG
jgi:hypothetical protein